MFSCMIVYKFLLNSAVFVLASGQFFAASDVEMAAGDARMVYWVALGVGLSGVVLTLLCVRGSHRWAFYTSRQTGPEHIEWWFDADQLLFDAQTKDHCVIRVLRPLLLLALREEPRALRVLQRLGEPGQDQDTPRLAQGRPRRAPASTQDSSPLASTGSRRASSRCPGRRAQAGAARKRRRAVCRAACGAACRARRAACRARRAEHQRRSHRRAPAMERK